MKPLTPAQQVVKRIAFVIFYALWFVPSMALLAIAFFVSMLFYMFAWIFTGKDHIGLADDIIFAPLELPCRLFGYN